MKRASRPKLAYFLEAARSYQALRILLAGGAMMTPFAAWAQSPVASSYATKDGRASTVILGCTSTNSTYFAQYCGVAGYPLHVTVDSGTVTVTGSSGGGSVPTTTPGTASAQVIGVQGGGSGALPVAVSATSLPLPSGAATSASQPRLDPGDGGAWSHITNFPTTQAVSGSVAVSALPALPAGSNAIGAVSVSNLPAINSDGGALVHVVNQGSTTVAGNVAVSNFPATQPVSGSVAVSGLPALPTGSNAIGSVTVSNLPATQPVSGTVTVSSLPALPAGSNALGSVSVSNFPATQAVSASALPLPSGASTAANQSTEISSLSTIASNTAGVATAAKQPGLNADGGELAHITNFPATQPVSAASLPLPSGAATAALQPALNSDGGALAHISNFPATQAVSGTVAVSSLPALASGSNAIGSVSVSNLPATQAISAASLPLPSGAATAALQPALNADGGALAHISNFPATQAVSGTVGVSSLPALPAGSNAIGSVSVGNFPATQTVSGTVAVSSLPALPAGTNAIGSVSVGNFPATQAVSVSNVLQAARSGAWTDASVTATATAAVPGGLAAVASRVGLHVWNVGSSTVCMNYTGTATVSGSGCAAGSVPIPAGSAYLEDQPGNVSPEAISLVCTGTSCPLTIKVR